MARVTPRTEQGQARDHLQSTDTVRGLTHEPRAGDGPPANSRQRPSCEGPALLSYAVDTGTCVVNLAMAVYQN